MRVAIATVICLCLTGCATIITGGTNQYITVKSTPPGATVTVDGKPDAGGITPLRTQVSRRMGHYVHIEKIGYEPADIEITQSFNGWFVLDFVLPPDPIAVLVDLADGSFLIDGPYDINVPLKPVSRPYARP